MSRKQRIHDLLTQAFNPSVLIVDDESHKHHVPKGAQTHFKVVLVTDAFQAIRMIERHRQINVLLADELNNGLHALSLNLYTEQEWQQRQEKTANTPACRDGYRHG